MIWYAIAAIPLSVATFSRVFPAEFGEYFVLAGAPGIVALVVVLVMEAVAGVNRWLAIRIQRRRRAATFGQLAAHCWLTPFARGSASSACDAADWLNRSGVNGPRVLLREVRLPHIAADPMVTEEEPIDTFVERNRVRRKGLWFQIFLFALAAVMLGRSVRIGAGQISSVIPVAVYVILIIFAIARLGFRPFSFPSILAAPGRVSCVARGRTLLLTREDSIMLIEPVGTAEDVMIRMERRDGRTLLVKFTGGTHDPMLERLVSRWCWRDGAGAALAERPLLDEEPLTPIVAAALDSRGVWVG